MDSIYSLQHLQYKSWLEPPERVVRPSLKNQLHLEAPSIHHYASHCWTGSLTLYKYESMYHNALEVK